MAALQNYLAATQDQQPVLSPSAYSRVINRIIWAVFDAEKDNSIKISIWKIPVSISISKLSPLIEHLVGPRPE